LRLQMLGMLAQKAFERDDLEVALDFAHRAVQNGREDYATNKEAVREVVAYLQFEANILESLGRLDEAAALDAEWLPLDRRGHQDIFVRLAKKQIALGHDAKAEQIIRFCLAGLPERSDVPEEFRRFSTKLMEGAFRPQTLLAELLERRGTEEALAEARTLRDKVAQALAEHEARRTTALEETRTEAAEAVRQWREERSKARGEKKGGGKSKKKGKKKNKKKKGRKGKAKGMEASSAAAIEGGPSGEPAGGEMEGAAAGEATAADAEQQAQEGESQPPDEEEEKEECATCLQDLELEDDEEASGDEGGDGHSLVLLKCGHRFHAVCGDMWCAKCANKGWGVTCPGCRVEPRMWW
jgi:hypothetical protein